MNSAHTFHVQFPLGMNENRLRLCNICKQGKRDMNISADTKGYEQRRAPAIKKFCSLQLANHCNIYSVFGLV